ncbi:MAG: DNA/RNA non-specific endonuclease [Marinagarivorans sp.]|nr:DNA/RNA non-specific endonuclease [Marinagarivorans sp.]
MCSKLTSFQIAAATAGNAAENNALFLIPLGLMALKAIDIALTSKDLWLIYMAYSNGNPVLGNTLLAEFLGDGAFDAAAGKIGGKLIPGFKTAEELLSYLNKNGYLSTSMMDSVKKVFDSNHAKAGTPPNSNSIILDTTGKTQVSVSTGARGAWDKRINGDLDPNQVYKLDNGHAFITDDKGRVTQVGGDLDPEKFDRNYYQQRLAGKAENATGYDGGHLIGTQLGGAGDKINLVPMTSGLNRGRYLQMENEIAKAMLDPNVKNVSIKIDVGYPPTNTVTPNKIQVTAIIDGNSINYEFEQ